MAVYEFMVDLRGTCGEGDEPREKVQHAIERALEPLQRDGIYLDSLAWGRREVSPAEAQEKRTAQP